VWVSQWKNRVGLSITTGCNFPPIFQTGRKIESQEIWSNWSYPIFVGNLKYSCLPKRKWNNFQHCSYDKIAFILKMLDSMEVGWEIPHGLSIGIMNLTLFDNEPSSSGSLSLHRCSQRGTWGPVRCPHVVIGEFFPVMFSLCWFLYWMFPHPALCRWTTLKDFRLSDSLLIRTWQILGYV